jgi:hypothetical protein
VSTKPASSHASIDVEGMNASNRDASPARGRAFGGSGSRRLDPLRGHGCDLVSHSRQPYSGRQANHLRGRSVGVLRRRRGALCTRDAGTWDGRLNQRVLSAYWVTIGVTCQDLELARPVHSQYAHLWMGGGETSPPSSTELGEHHRVHQSGATPAWGATFCVRVRCPVESPLGV